MNAPNPPRPVSPRSFAYQNIDKAARSPRCRLVVGGQTVGGVVSASVTSNSYFSADTWSAKVALGPDASRDAEWWGTQAEVECEVLFSLGSDEFRSLIVGTADSVEIDEPEGLLSLHGRDFTAKLQNSPVLDDYHNQRASDIARKFAAENGLAADVEDTPGTVGQLIDTDGAAASTGEFTHATDQWSYLCFLAQQYPGFYVRVVGRVLTFKRMPESAPVTPGSRRVMPSVLTWAKPGVDAAALATVRGRSLFNAKTLRVERDLTRAKDIEVVVRSWRGSEARQFEVVARRQKAEVRRERSGEPKADDPLARELAELPSDSVFADRTKPKTANDRAPLKQSGIHRYIIERPGLTHDQALQLAEAKLKEASLHERKIVVGMPGEIDLSPTDTVRLVGHSTGWDQDYYVDSIERRLSVAGFEQTLTCKNESPGGTTLITTSG